MIKIKLLIMLLCTFILIMMCTLQSSAQPASHRPSILFINVGFYSIPERDVLDEKYLEDIKKQGYLVDLIKMDQLTKERLYQYNVAVITGLVITLNTDEVEIFRSKIPLLKEYLADGGGVLLCDYGRDLTLESTNEFMKEYGLEALAETVWDENKYFQQEKFMREYFLTTTNITKHPITTGIDKVIVPLYTYETRTFNAGKDWTILISGEETTISTPTDNPQPGREIKQGTYKSNPPIFAVREVGKGRLAHLGVSPYYTFHSGNHVVYEGRVLKQGNLFKLLQNTFNWLTKPSMKIASIGTFTGPSYSVPKPPKNNFTDVRVFPIEHTIPKDMHGYLGLLGAHSNLTDGTSEVAEYCECAKELGYSFLVFTEPLEMMDKEKYSTLVEKCKKASDEAFLALPGIEYTDLNPGSEQNRFIITYMLDWFKDEWLTDDKKNMRHYAASLLFENKWPIIAVVTPSLNPHRLDWIKFYTAIATHNYEDGKLIDDNIDRYLERVKNFYRSSPITYHKILKPSDIPELGNTFVTGASAGSLKDLDMEQTLLRRQYYSFAGWGWTPFVTNGPRINYCELVMSPWGDFLVMREQQWKYYYDVESDNPIVEIQLWDGMEPFRIIKVDNQKRVQGSFTGFHEKQHYLTLRVIDNAGKMAMSGPSGVIGIRHRLNMCDDQQNNFDGGFQVGQSGKLEWSWVAGHFITGAAWIGPRLNVPENELSPPGRDAHFTFPLGQVGYFICAEGGYDEWVLDYIDHYFASEECTIIDYSGDHVFLPNSSIVPSQLCTSRSRYYAFTPRLYNWNILLIEDEIEVIKDAILSSGYPNSPKLRGLTYNIYDIESLNYYAYRNAEGEMKTAQWKKDGKPIEEKPITNMLIPAGGYVGLYPDFYGSFVVFPLDKEVEASFWYPNLGFGFGKGGESLKKGDTFNYRFLSALKWQTEGQKDFEMLRTVYGLDGSKPAYDVEIKNGRVADTVYALSLEATNYNVSCAITKSPQMPTDLPLILKGINERWNVSLYGYDTGTIKRVGAIDGTAYSQIDINGRDRKIFFGNSFTCDNNDVWLELMEVKGQEPGEDKTALVEINNPTDTPLSLTLTSPLFSFEEKVDIDSKTITIIEVPLPEWKGRKITLYTDELTNQGF